jgi:putative transposase
MCRYVHILGGTATSSGAWTVQQIQNLLIDPGDRATSSRCLVRDKAGRFTASFDAVLADVGIEVVKIPPRSPRASVYAERFVLTTWTEITDRMLIFDEWHLQAVLARYEANYNGWPGLASDLVSLSRRLGGTLGLVAGRVELE